MAEVLDFSAQAAVLRREAAELRVTATHHTGAAHIWHNRSDAVFNQLADNQIQADKYYHSASLARLEAKKKRKEADKLDRKAARLSRRAKGTRR